MAEQMSHGPTTYREPANRWATGFAYFAGCVMVVAGIFGVFAGIAAILKNDVFVFRGDYVFKWDVTGWGWVHLGIGVLLVVAGLAVFTGQLWARVVGIVAAVISAVANFVFLPFFPLWAIVIIALDIVVIWALATYSPERAAY
ncbi:DUF7144 family membrane protein [Actinomadura viridis]|uniref:Phage shock protein PspC (Stress-responsive transcriptional regulator) n=1 Tax=Actinomadura viridis TaxID=58110 RepID=A0A931GLT0_9ACTN|nr:hypothetical protein [Actinomadura viridis]MBG6092388.1 phage shock protein PspC (stress-responsive transcriptional regulator) [Actinomadura viridis]